MYSKLHIGNDQQFNQVSVSIMHDTCTLRQLNFLCTMETPVMYRWLCMNTASSLQSLLQFTVQPNQMSLSFYTQLSDNFSRLLEWADDFNTIIQVGKQPEIKSFEAHSVVLRARSEYFRTALSSSWSRTQGGKYIFEKPNISPNVFEIIIK